MAKSDGDLDTLRQDLEQLRTDVAALRQHLVEAGAARVEAARAVGAARLGELEGGLVRLADGLGTQGREGLARLERTVKERPLASLLAAFGLGVLLSQLLDRR